MVRTNISEESMLAKLYDFCSEIDYKVSNAIDCACRWATPGSSTKAIIKLTMFKFLLNIDGETETSRLTDIAIQAIKNWQKTGELVVSYSYV